MIRSWHLLPYVHFFKELKPILGHAICYVLKWRLCQRFETPLVVTIENINQRKINGKLSSKLLFYRVTSLNFEANFVMEKTLTWWYRWNYIRITFLQCHSITLLPFQKIFDLLMKKGEEIQGIISCFRQRCSVTKTGSKCRGVTRSNDLFIQERFQIWPDLCHMASSPVLRHSN